MLGKFRELRADEIECRVATVSDKGCSLLLYKDARCDQNILDETVGPMNWKRDHQAIDGRLYCTVSIHNDETNEWVSKQDVGTESYTEKEKGQASDSFKRACFNWGIGRELYTAPFIWIRAADGNVALTDKGGKKTTYDKFTVGDICYENGKIVALSIWNKSIKKRAFFVDSRKKEEKEETPDPVIDAIKIGVLRDMMKKKGVQESKIVSRYHVKTLAELKTSQFMDAMKGLEATKPVENVDLGL